MNETYKGKIFFFQAPKKFNSIYDLLPDEYYKITSQVATATVNFDGKVFHLFFNCMGEGFEVKFQFQSSNIFVGDILRSGDNAGSATLYVYGHESNLVCKGSWDEYNDFWTFYLELEADKKSKS